MLSMINLETAQNKIRCIFIWVNILSPIYICIYLIMRMNKYSWSLFIGCYIACVLTNGMLCYGIDMLYSTFCNISAKMTVLPVTHLLSAVIFRELINFVYMVTFGMLFN